MPVVGNNRCLELDSVVLQRFRSCSSLVFFDISVVAGAGSFGPDCSDEQRGRRLGFAFRVGPTGVGRVFLVFSPVPGAGSFLSCSTSSSTLSGSGCSSRSTGTPDVRLPVPMLSNAYGLLQEFIPVVFDYREHDLRCGGLLLGQGQQGLRDHGVVGGVQAGVLVVFVCDGHFHALTQLTCQWTQLSCRWTLLSCQRTQLSCWRAEPSCRRTQL